MKISNPNLIIIGVVWLTAVVTGTGMILNYDNTSSVVPAVSFQWPSASKIKPVPGEATLIMAAHPRCPCTRASVEELASIMANVPKDKVKVYVLFVKPPGFSDDWARADLWRSAEAIPGVEVVLDPDGSEAKLFRTEVSGQTVLYDANGQLLFSGGITGARGHIGDNAGQSAIISLVRNGKSDRTGTPSFGCLLFNKEAER